MTDLVPYQRPAAPLVHPASGELLDLNGATDYLAERLLEIRDLEAQLRHLKEALTSEVLHRMDGAATWTVEAGRYKVRGRSPDPEIVYDGEALWNGLHSIARDFGLDEQAIRNAITEERVFKVSKRGVNALRKLGGEVARIIDRCSSEETSRRYVSVSVVR